MEGPVAGRLRVALTEALAPAHLELLNESDSHAGPPGRESHFRVVIVAEAFRGQPLVARHRRVYASVEQELANGVHALAIVAKTPEEWALGAPLPVSPPCAGGEKKTPSGP